MTLCLVCSTCKVPANPAPNSSTFFCVSCKASLLISVFTELQASATLYVMTDPDTKTMRELYVPIESFENFLDTTMIMQDWSHLTPEANAAIQGSDFLFRIFRNYVCHLTQL